MEQDTVPCKFCGTPTRMLGTKQCDNCHEVACRVGSMPTSVLRKILRESRYHSVAGVVFV